MKYFTNPNNAIERISRFIKIAFNLNANDGKRYCIHCLDNDYFLLEVENSNLKITMINPNDLEDKMIFTMSPDSITGTINGEDHKLDSYLSTAVAFSSMFAYSDDFKVDIFDNDELIESKEYHINSDKLDTILKADMVVETLVTEMNG